MKNTLLLKLSSLIKVAANITTDKYGYSQSENTDPRSWADRIVGLYTGSNSFLKDRDPITQINKAIPSSAYQTPFYYDLLAIAKDRKFTEEQTQDLLNTYKKDINAEFKDYQDIRDKDIDETMNPLRATMDATREAIRNGTLPKPTLYDKFSTTSDLFLTTAGLYPGAGEPFDVVNGLIGAGEWIAGYPGGKVRTMGGAIAAFPILGNSTSSARLASKAQRLASKVPKYNAMETKALLAKLKAADKAKYPSRTKRVLENLKFNMTPKKITGKDLTQTMATQTLFGNAIMQGVNKGGPIVTPFDQLYNAAGLGIHSNNTDEFFQGAKYQNMQFEPPPNTAQ